MTNLLRDLRPLDQRHKLEVLGKQRARRAALIEEEAGHPLPMVDERIVVPLEARDDVVAVPLPKSLRSSRGFSACLYLPKTNKRMVSVGIFRERLKPGRGSRRLDLTQLSLKSVAGAYL